MSPNYGTRVSYLCPRNVILMAFQWNNNVKKITRYEKYRLLFRKRNPVHHLIGVFVQHPPRHHRRPRPRGDFRHERGISAKAGAPLRSGTGNKHSIMTNDTRHVKENTLRKAKGGYLFRSGDSCRWYLQQIWTHYREPRTLHLRNVQRL